MNLTVEHIPQNHPDRAWRTNVVIGLFCFAMIAAIWAVLLGQIHYERRQVVESEFAATANLALAFEEHTARVLKSAEQTLRLIGREYARQGAQLDIQKMIDTGLIDTDVLSFVGVTDQHGRSILGAPEFKAVDVTDRDYFQFYQQHDGAEMFIGKPVLGRVRGKWIVPLARRINKPDGSFGGVAYASLDIDYFNRLFEQANLGTQGLAMLVGLDGIARARRTGSLMSSGQDMSKSSLRREQSKKPVGSYASIGVLDGVPRFLSYRTLHQYPLIIVVGAAQAEVLAPTYQRERIYYAANGLASGFIILCGYGLIFALSRQRRGFKAIYESQARYGVAFNQAAVGVARIGLDGRMLEVNRKLCDMLDYPADELLKLTNIDFTFPDDQEITRESMDRLRSSQHGPAFEMLEKRYLRKDGTQVWVMVTAALVRDVHGNPDCFMTVVQDITDRKRSEMLLADSERRFRALVENAADAIAIIDRNGSIAYVSPAMISMAGYEWPEVKGRNFLEFVHPDDVERSRAEFEELHHAAGQSLKVERRLRHKNGNWLILETIAKNALDDPTIQGFVFNARDVTERKQTEQSLIKLNRALKALSSCNGILIRALNEPTLIQHMCDNIVETGGYLLAWVGVVEYDAQKTVRPVAHAGYQKGFMERAQITWADNEQGRGPVGAAIRTRKAQVVQNAHTDPAFQLWQANAATLGYGSILALPLMFADDVIGVLTIYSSDVDAFDAAEMQLLGELADDLAFGMVTLRARVVHEKSEQRLLRGMEGTILAMAATLEMRDAYTAGHQRRVADLAVAIAREMGMGKDEIHGLYLAAVIHDLGKIQIPAEILSKPTRLTPIEYELIKTHPEAGYNILKEVDFQWPIAQMVFQHHERLDGSGYPRGLKGDDILPGARILAVADTVEAMFSHRPYRAGLGIDKALGEIMQNRGVIYDAAVVDACVKLFREKRFELSG